MSWDWESEGWRGVGLGALMFFASTVSYGLILESENPMEILISFLLGFIICTSYLLYALKRHNFSYDIYLKNLPVVGLLAVLLGAFLGSFIAMFLSPAFMLLILSVPFIITAIMILRAVLRRRG